MEKQITHESQEVRSLSGAQIRTMKNRKAVSFSLKIVDIEANAKKENRPLTDQEKNAIENYAFMVEMLS